MSSKAAEKPSSEAALDPHWEQLFRNAEELISFISEETDPFVFDLMERHFDELEPMEGMDHGDTMVHLVSMFVDRTTVAGNPTTMRDGIIYLARSGWNLETAIQNIHSGDAKFAVEEPSDEEREHSSSELSEPPAEGDEELEPELEPELSSDDGGEAVEAGDTKKTRKERRQRAVRRLNPNIDRSKVAKGYPQPEKLTFSIRIPKKSGSVINQSHFLKYDNGKNLDWNNGEHVRQLNKWREQLFLRRLGPSRPPRITYHAAERRWLVNRHLQFQRDTQARTGHIEDWRTFPWHNIMQEFNAHFAGKIIDGAPRPSRTKMSLRDEKGRMLELTTLTGAEPKKAPALLGGKGAVGEEGVEEKAEESSGEEEEEGSPAKKRRIKEERDGE
ncbi:hypothetical protein P7C71_g2646, partial [Lecanoromycetidae sp. Uapishka_2]